MSVCRKLPDGTIQKIAGHTILLDANASEVREGTITLPEYSGAPMYHVTHVTFSDPMPDTGYAVVWNLESSPYWPEKHIRVGAKTTTGFDFYISIDGGNSAAGTVLHYIAWKPVKIEGYTELQNKVNNPDNTPTIDSMNLVTSDGVARAIENASAVWKGTRAAWNALPAADKRKYDLAVLTDTQLIKSVDRTYGSDSDVADLTGKIFRGTEEEWEALSAAEKNEYEQAELRMQFQSVPRLAFGYPGFIQAFAGASDKVPDGWLMCDGTEYSVSTYPELYDVIGNIYGGTVGSTFKVPDLRGEFLRGAGVNPTTGYAGALVGTHQEPTYIPRVYCYDTTICLESSNGSNAVINDDKQYGTGNLGIGSRQSTWAESSPLSYSARPTNTSVNYIIHV